MAQFDRHYTIQEANALLPEIREILAELRAARSQLVEDWRRAQPVLRAAPRNGGGAEASDYVTDLRALSDRLRWFSERSIILKDIDRGLVDFPALRNEDEVLLCWEDREDRVAYWHDFEAGYAGRQPW